MTRHERIVAESGVAFDLLRFHFLSREEVRRHVHVEGEDGEAKFWLESEIEPADRPCFSCGVE